MEDPSAALCTKLFAMYDSSETSNDEILDCAVACLQCCHTAIVAMMANRRFLEAYRQFQHCEDIIRERNTERKIITCLSESDADRKLFAELDARTMQLHHRFELQRTTTVDSSGLGLGGRAAPRPPATHEVVGPPHKPLHGSGGVLERSLRRYSSSNASKSKSFAVLAPRAPVSSLAITSGADVAALHLQGEGSKTADTDSVQLPTIKGSSARLEPPIMKIDVSASAIDGTSERQEPVVPSVEAVPCVDWRQRGAAHLQRASVVLQNAKQSILDMKRKTEELQAKRDAAVNGALVDTERATARVRSAGASRSGKSSPLRPNAGSSPPRLPSAERAAASPDKRQAAIEKAEKDLLSRLESSAKRVSERQLSVTERQLAHHRSSPPRAEDMAALTNILYRRRSEIIREQESPKSSATTPRPVYRRTVPSHASFEEYTRLADVEEKQDTSDAEDELPSDDLQSPRFALAALRPIAPRVDGVLTPQTFSGAELSGVTPRVAAAATSSSLSCISTTRLAAKIDKRIAQVQSGSQAKRLFSGALRDRLEQRASELVAGGKLFTPAPPIRMTTDELERFLSHETVAMLKQKRNNSFFFPSLLEPDASCSAAATWSSLADLRRVSDWTTLPSREMMSNLDLCVATLRLQSWWRQHRSVAERRRRATRVATFVTQYHQQVEATAVLVRVFRMQVAARRVSAVRSLVATVNEHRIELEQTLKSRFMSIPDEGTDRPPVTSQERLMRTRKQQRRTLNDTHKTANNPLSVGESWSEEMLTTISAKLSDWYGNPFPPFHPHYGTLVGVQRQVAGRAILAAYRRYVHRCFEELQRRADLCLHHLISGEYRTEKEVFGEAFDSPFAFADPFGRDNNLLAKYGGDVIGKCEEKLRGEGPDVNGDLVMLQHVKLSELAAKRRADEDANLQSQQQALERQRRVAEQEQVELQRRNFATLLVQRVGRGYRRRQVLTRTYNAFHNERHQMHVQLEQLSFSFSGRSTPTVSSRESPSFETKAASEIMHLIAQRNPDLLPSRREELHAARVQSAVMVQRHLRVQQSASLKQHKSFHAHAATIQRAWRCVWLRLCEERQLVSQLRQGFTRQTSQW